MQDEPIALRQGLTLLQFKVPASLHGLVSEGPDSEGVCGEQSVVAGVPPGWMAKIALVIEDGDDLGGACGVRSMIGNPPGPFAPCVVVLHSFAVGDLALGNFANKAQGRSGANGKASFLGIPESNVVPGGVHDRGHVNEPGFPGKGDVILALLQNDRLAFCLPGKFHGECYRRFTVLLTDFCFGNPARHDFAVVLVPEVMPVDVSVGEPESGVVRMVRFFSGHILNEGVLPCEVRAGGAHQGIEAGNPGVAMILGEEFSIDNDLQVPVLLLQVDLDVGGKRDRREEREGESEVESAHDVGQIVKQGGMPGGRRNADCFPLQSGSDCFPDRSLQALEFPGLRGTA